MNMCPSRSRRTPVIGRTADHDHGYDPSLSRAQEVSYRVRDRFVEGRGIAVWGNYVYIHLRSTPYALKLNFGPFLYTRKEDATVFVLDFWHALSTAKVNYIQSFNFAEPDYRFAATLCYCPLEKCFEVDALCSRKNVYTTFHRETLSNNLFIGGSGGGLVRESHADYLGRLGWAGGGLRGPAS